MNNPVTRRKALQSVATAGAGALLGQGIGLSEGTSIQIAGRPVEIALTSISRQTVRITILPIENGQPLPVPIDGALIQENWGPPAMRLRTPGTRRVKCGDLTVRLSGD